MEMREVSMSKKEGVVLEKNKIEGFFGTIETLMDLSGEDAKKYAALTFCEFILKELPSENPEVSVLKDEIVETRRSARGNKSPDMEKLQEAIDKVKRLYEELK